MGANSTPSFSTIEHTQKALLSNDKLRMLVESKLNGITQSIARTHNSLLHINTLPVEILSEIFTFACLYRGPYDPNKERYWRYTDPRKERNSVMRTCSHWRDIVLTTTTLWSCIIIGLSRHIHHLPIMTELEIQRSGQTALSLYLSLYDPFFTDHPVQFDVLSLINRCRPRIRFLDIDFGVRPFTFLEGHLASKVFGKEHHWPCLHHLSVVGHFVRPGEDIGIVDLSLAPLLQKVRIYQSDSQESVIRPSLSEFRRSFWHITAPRMSRITSLNIGEGVDPKRVLSFLAMSPLLESFCWTLGTGQTYDDDTYRKPDLRKYPNLSLPRLHTLKMMEQACGYLGLINAPSLHHLGIFDFEDVSTPLPHFPHLTSFALETSNAIDEQDAGFNSFIIAHSSSLEEFSFNQRPHYPEYLSVFNERNRSNTAMMFSRLRRIRLGSESTMCPDVEKWMEEFLADRTQHSLALRPFSFECLCSKNRRIPAKLSELCLAYPASIELITVDRHTDVIDWDNV